MNVSNANEQFISKREFHKENAQLPYEKKVMQIIELQKIDLEFSKNRREQIPAYKRVWVIRD
jgi:hypothetical protein